MFLNFTFLTLLFILLTLQEANPRALPEGSQEDVRGKVCIDDTSQTSGTHSA